MNQPNCALCDIIITDENDTKEHIIPNAIGGRKKVKGFICKACNNSTGNSWESELAKQFNPLSLLFSINRERGNVPSQLFETTAGEKLKLNVDGSMANDKPVYTETPLGDNKVKINIQARDQKEAKSMLDGVKKKYPKFDIDDALNKLQIRSSYCPDMLKMDFSLGGAEAGRSIVKSALALAVYSGITASTCKEAIDYLRNEESESCFGYFYESDLIRNRPEGIPIHCVSIKGCDKSNQVIAYVEYFGIQRMVLCLGSSYTGKAVSSTYSINPITGEELNLEVELNISNAEIHQAYNYEKFPADAMEKAFHAVMPIAFENSHQRERERVLDKAILQAFNNCGAKEDERLTDEHIQNIMQTIINEIKPFLLHNMVKPNSHR